MNELEALRAENARLKARCEFAVMRWTELAAAVRNMSSYGWGHAWSNAEAQVAEALAEWDREHSCE